MTTTTVNTPIYGIDLSRNETPPNPEIPAHFEQVGVDPPAIPVHSSSHSSNGDSSHPSGMGPPSHSAFSKGPTIPKRKIPDTYKYLRVFNNFSRQ